MDKKTRNYLFRITAPHFCAGLVYNTGTPLSRTAPILHYMYNWKAKDIEKYCRKKGWKMEVMPCK